MFLVPFKKGQKNGSVILVTTRLPASAQIVKTTDQCIDLQGLDPGSFKDLFRAHAFGDKQSMDGHSELLKTGDKIVEKLKGSPLAAKTVGKLLKNNLDLGHWTRVLDSKESLKLSFDYLPFHLQQYFIYSALFPEDYKFGKEELIHFWIGLDVLHSNGQNKRIEDIGECYLIELVNHGFFKKEEDEHGRTYYIIHDLLHELAIKVSEGECLSICSSSNVRSVQIPPSIRHLSINVDDSSIKDKNTFDTCKEDFIVLGKRLKVENLHSLMLFGKEQSSFVKTFRELFSKAHALRFIFISGGKYKVEDLFQNFLSLFHLRYIRIQNKPWERSQPPKKISRFYHLKVLDLQGCNMCCDLPRHMSNLLKLHHFLVPDDQMHASILDIGHLLELHGSLNIDKLENIKGREEAEEAKLIQDTPEMLEHGSPFPPSCKLQSLETDDIAGVLAAPVCTLLSSSLTSLAFVSNMEMERFTKEQGATLQPLTSLQQLKLSNCSASHPPGLQTLTNLKTLHIRWCRSIRSLPKDNLPNSLRKLTISGCSSIRSLPKDGLPDSLLELEISFCPSIRALPKGGLPSSLQKLDVSYGNSEELTRQCRKLIGTIPIVEV
ncbi:hypothetical protein HU200_028953 [Digitaria exilis]|uniref:Disease resistance protein winged helix domain-containing protein n=1 Tax=Digitaria exilis TaxID=1010633 RepID=A0A835BUY7_9POAL|nr:hypothetical protein HU200_028953 [Digitaria exilis]